LKPERKQDRARGVLAQAAGRFASNPIGAHATHAALDQPGPHALVDPTYIGTLDDEGPERTRRRRQLRPVALERDDRDLKAERAERITYLLQSGSHASRRLQTGCGRELTAELLACLAERLRPTPSGNPLDQQADQLRQLPVGELDPLELRRDAVDLGGTPGSGTAPATAPLERDIEESRLGEAIEPTAGDVAVHVERDRSLSGGERIAPASRVQEDPPKLRIAGRCKPIERHGGKIYPPAGYQELQQVKPRGRGGPLKLEQVEYNASFALTQD
jgi:hypothetical protein